MGNQEDIAIVAEEEEGLLLSLCDDPPRTNYNGGHSVSQPSNSEAMQELFQFFCDTKSEMCSAEDVMECGKLIPFKQSQTPLSVPTLQHIINEDNKHANAFRKRSESLPEIKTSDVTRSDSIRNTLTRSSRSLDYRNLRRSSSSLEIDRNSSVKSTGKYDFPVKRLTRSKWFVMMFGVVKFPVEMELSDMKNRQSRVNSPPFFPPAADHHHGCKNLAVNRISTTSSKGSSSSSWRLLKALSCKDHGSVPATAPFCMSRV